MGNAFFDQSYYLSANPDVQAAGVDAESHFQSYGWQEGRNPSARFDLAYYLAGNPDVRAAGINPLDHFLNFGAAEGRSPLSGFSESAYLAANPDVADAVQAGRIGSGLLHYARYGATEHRNGAGVTDSTDTTPTVANSGSAAMAAGTHILRVSSAADGTPGNAESDTVSGLFSGTLDLSQTGRYVVFASLASNLVSNDTNGVSDVFVKDVVTGTVTCVSSAGGVQADHLSYRPSISSDGRWVAFDSLAGNLTAGDDNAAYDCFVKNLASGAISRHTSGTPLQDGSGGYTSGVWAAGVASLSSDGQFLAYQLPYTYADGSPAVMNSLMMVNLASNETSLINSKADGSRSQVEGSSTLYAMESPVALSDYGRYVAFASLANDLTADDTDSRYDVFLKDTLGGTITRISAFLDNDDASKSLSFERHDASPALSADGRYVVLASNWSKLYTAGQVWTPGDITSGLDIYRIDTLTGTVALVSAAADGTPGNAGSNNPSISADGRYVAFRSNASNLVGGDSNALADIFVKDLVSGAIVRANTSADGAQANHLSEKPTLSPDAHTVAFSSYANNLVSGDGDWGKDVFLVNLVGLLPGIE